MIPDEGRCPDCGEPAELLLIGPDARVRRCHGRAHCARGNKPWLEPVHHAGAPKPEVTVERGWVRFSEEEPERSSSLVTVSPRPLARTTPRSTPTRTRRPR